MDNSKSIRRESFYLHNYNYTECKSAVLNYQIKIYESAKNGNKSLMKTYQKYLVKQKKACFLALRRVCTNHGGKTPSIDGYIPKTK